MECRWHPGQTADVTCLKCGQQFCRECVKETREPNYCPDCHREQVDRLASQLAPPPKKEKPAREPAVKKEDKKLKKPSKEKAGPPPVPAREVAPPPPPASTVRPEDRDEFWGEVDRPRKTRKAAKRAEGPVRVEGLPPPIVQPGAPRAPEPGVSAPLEPRGEPPVIPDSQKRRILPEDVRQKQVMTAEGFPTEPREEEPERRGKHGKVRERRIQVESPVAFQVPDDYDGEVTSEPSYLKAVLWGLLAAVLAAGAYAAFAWWRYKLFGIICWVIGVIVGVVVVFASGRHFNWKLGLIAAGLALFSISLGQLLTHMFQFWWPPYPMSEITSGIPKITGMKEAVITFGKDFGTIWLLYFFIAGAVAFLLSFRPWPIRLQAASRPAKRVARRA